MRKYLMLVVGMLRVAKEWILCFGGLKLHGIKYYFGRGVRCWVHEQGRLDFGKKNWLSDGCSFEAAGGCLSLGYNNFFNTNCRVIALESIKIGDNNLFGPNVVIVDHDHAYQNKDELICKQGFNKDGIEIGSDCWICANVVITKGSKIADHIVVAANSVVKGTLEQPGTYVGCPAKLIK